MWLVPTCMSVAVGIRWWLGVTGSRMCFYVEVYAHDNWWTCVAMADECGWFPRVWRWQLEVVGVPVFAGASWMWLVPAFVVVAPGCGPGTRVWRYHLDMVAAHGYGGDSLMYLVLTCVAMVIGCDWYPRVWLWQLGMVGGSRVWR